ncbi:O-methyltransferase family 3 [Salinarchaeum sp. Harcht-Bsk1]|uniref:O-methyltransferase n=1 Tax=Salinarchaeum sp. Harcht-Bsk1 TaxID=1333523 RepID=UPI00034236AE|nr:O-methyltransferase [Salinarchaeum sp. Harcht-Bsk1]AGN02838.1 O-methyltransferase family 3 [Salinarchaeum sp. Harcht-Bsk1]
MTLLSDDIARFVRATGPEPDDVLEEMDEYAEEHGFPHVGSALGGWLQFLARMVDAEHVFEFGSGYGYSAYWFARALPDDGRIVCTEIDEDEIEMGREYLARGGFGDVVSYEHGDAVEIVDRYDGPFDVVLIDHQKHRYAEAFEAVRDKVAPGGIVVADNVMTGGTIDFDALLEAWHGEEPLASDDEMTRGIDEYLHTVRDDPAFETTVLPLGEGLSVSHREQ